MYSSQVGDGCTSFSVEYSTLSTNLSSKIALISVEGMNELNFHRSCCDPE